MGKWNEEAAPNLNLKTGTLKTSKFVTNKAKQDHEFSEELADGEERNEIIERDIRKE
ncbi:MULTISPECIES: hypothetical protein [Bacillaceae]|uniref:Uncharacterized protein n=1 Tax=Evansella alkalicola TaxID=745819 RepID=A0ABS6JWA2_9BACI|nr:MULTISPECIES: hypothetical protein [Bacillaceae]MBU9721410.1 hypothetical protein [Bacillus alkalicola]